MGVSKTRKVKQRGGSNNNNNNNNTNNNDYFYNKLNKHYNNMKPYKKNLQFIKYLKEGDTEAIGKIIDSGYDVNSYFPVAFAEYYYGRHAREFTQREYIGTFLSYLAASSIINFKDIDFTNEYDEFFFPRMITFLLQKGADPESIFESESGSTGEQTPLSIFICSGERTNALQILNAIISKRVWTREDSSNTLNLANRLRYYQDYQYMPQEVILEWKDILQEKEEESVRLAQERKNRIAHQEKMKNVLHGVKRQPTRNYKRNLLLELNVLPPISGISHEGGPGYRRAKEAFTALSQGQPLPINKNSLTRKNYNWKRAEKYMK